MAIEVIQPPRESPTTTRVGEHILQLASNAQISNEFVDDCGHAVCVVAVAMRLGELVAIALSAMIIACEPPVCDEVGPPYAFHVSVSYGWGGVLDGRDLDVTLTAASDDWHLDQIAILPTGDRGTLDIEWGGAEPDRSVGEFLPSEESSLMPLVLIAKLDDEGCAVTQHALANNTD